jgi:FkbM family methyltransferase
VIIETAGIKFVVDNEIERYRAETLLTKEPGTIRWLDHMGHGDVFYDVGANIGCYTLYAAKRGATVYAFEPHVGNAWRLLQNIAANGLSGAVRVFTNPLHDTRGIVDFFYASTKSGSSGSQLGHTQSEDGSEFKATAVESKYALTLDDFGIPKDGFIKIDVDGNEAAILRPVAATLRRAKSIQVEIHPGVEVESLLLGFQLVEKHYTSNGQKQLDAGVPPEQITYNGVFDRV